MTSSTTAAPESAGSPRAARRRHLARQGLLGGRLDAGVDARHEVATGDRVDPRHDAGDEATRVDRHGRAARGPAQGRVVLLLQPGPADEVVRVTDPAGRDLLLGGAPEVAEQVGGVDPQRRRVAPHRHRLDGHAREEVRDARPG